MSSISKRAFQVAYQRGHTEGGLPSGHTKGANHGVDPMGGKPKWLPKWESLIGVPQGGPAREVS